LHGPRSSRSLCWTWCACRPPAPARPAPSPPAPAGNRRSGRPNGPPSRARPRRVAAQLRAGSAALLPGHLLPPWPRPAPGATPGSTGALFVSYAAGQLLVTPLAGWLTDRFGARTALLLGLAALLGATLLFAAAETLPTLALARAGQGVASGVTWTAGMVLL